jgi:glycosyltransferase involved in cell wall biosynthesis
MRIAIITGAYTPFINGVTTSVVETERELRRRGHDVLIISPQSFETDPTLPPKRWRASFPCPGYRLVRLVKPTLKNQKLLANLLDEFAPETLHITTECTLGLLAKRYAKRRAYAFTTAYHTRFPEYIAQIAHEKFHLPFTPSRASANRYLRLFHRGSAAVMVTLPTLARELTKGGFRNVKIWSRGVDHSVFTETGDHIDLGPKPIFMHYGRLSRDKGFPEFCALSLPGTMIAVGEGPADDVATWQMQYPHVRFMGSATGAARGAYLRSADVMVFMSTTDTFGLTTIEANACGTPVAAVNHFPHTDLIENGINGWVLDDVKAAALRAAAFTPAMRHACAKTAERYTWQLATDEFITNLVPVTSHS